MKRLYSSRLAWSTEQNRLSRIRAGKEHYLDLTVSNPTQADLLYPEDEISSVLGDRRALTYIPEPLGLCSAREAVSEYYARRGIAVSPERIVLTASTSEAYSMLFKLFCDPGDDVLVPQPSYPLFEYLARLESVECTPYQLVYDGRWTVPFLQTGPRTKALIAVSPNNPTGSLADVASLWTAGVPMIVDEVFADYTVSGVYPAHFDGAFYLSGLSKAAGLPQMKLGWIVCPDRVPDELELIADTYLSVGAPVQYALPRLLELGAVVREQIRERCLENDRWLRERLRGSNSTPLRIEGGWTVPIELPRVKTEEDLVCDLLEREDVMVQPGYFYDFPREAYIIVSLLTQPAVFREGIERLLRTIS